MDSQSTIRGLAGMELEWTTAALDDLKRLHSFLAAVNEPAAGRAVAMLGMAAKKLVSNPRLGRQLEKFRPREVRRIIVGAYEIRYEIQAARVIVLRLWHTREDR